MEGFGQLRLADLVRVSRQPDGGQHADDGDDHHQLNQGETLVRFVFCVQALAPNCLKTAVGGLQPKNESR